DERSHATHLPGQVLDLTGVKYAEDRIRFQASVLDQVHNAVMTTDMKGAITYWNKRAESLLGWTESEVVGCRFADVVLPENSRDLLATLYAYLSELGMWEGELTMLRKDGSTFPAWASDILVRDDSGTPVGFAGVSLDMTEIKAAE